MLWYNQRMNSTTESIVGKLLGPVFQTLPPETARQIVNLEADPQTQRLITELATKANNGELTPQEEADYATLVETGDILATLQALARRTLQRTTTE